MFAAGLIIFAQGPTKVEAAADNNSGLEIKVLDSASGSGSRAKEVGKPELQIELLGATTSSGGELKGSTQAEVVPALAVGDKKTLLAANDEGKQGKTKGEKSSKDITEEEKKDQERDLLFGALDKWHSQTLLNYTYDIASLEDPFMPIKAVRIGQNDGEPIDPVEEAKKPPILRCELNQLKLVAITSLSDRPGGSLASFEDGAGSSYILREGDRICRNNGRITKIDDNQVIVEEPPRGMAKGPIITPIKLSVPKTLNGLVLSSDQ